MVGVLSSAASMPLPEATSAWAVACISAGFIMFLLVEVSLDVFAQFDDPIGEINDVFPAIVLVKAELDLDKGTPLRRLRFENEVQTGILRGEIGLECIAADTRTDNVFPGSRPAPVARDDVVQIQVFAVENLAAILAGVLVALEDIVPGEFDFLLRHVIVNDQQNHSGDTDAERNGADRFRVRFLLREIMPFAEIVGLKRTIAAIEHRSEERRVGKEW